ncbi:MAG: hypothetical protein HYW89_01805 [Candidatus Sungiibacteriota bacterium]|uniref:Uncharacterized protein n=1 Tax=Candidatus Sungiibacteriota bacterium TaxID=2750080 RepID=A0A7T5UQA9_9BACT|nr:MAG: hypothetical protein HYW89_01805 [Candidatus Sungbacteria bacterium]
MGEHYMADGFYQGRITSIKRAESRNVYEDEHRKQLVVSVDGVPFLVHKRDVCRPLRRGALVVFTANGGWISYDPYKFDQKWHYRIEWLAEEAKKRNVKGSRHGFKVCVFDQLQVPVPHTDVWKKGPFMSEKLKPDTVFRPALKFPTDMNRRDQKFFQGTMRAIAAGVPINPLPESAYRERCPHYPFSPFKAICGDCA